MSHWYTRDGKPCFKQQKHNGQERDTHVGDARKQGLLPSVTGIIEIKANQGLEAHRRRAIAKAAYQCPPSSFETEDEWTSYVLAKANSEQFANHTSDPQRQCERHNYLMV